jgi:hypothetical protein
MCGSPVARTLKTRRGHNRFNLVWTSEPVVQQYGVVGHVRNAQLEVTNRRIKREFGRGLCDAILEFLVIESMLSGQEPNPLLQEPMPPLIS